MVLHLWGESSGPPMYMLHFCFGAGGLLAPLIVRPFLSPNQSPNGNSTDNDIVANFTNINQNLSHHQYNYTSDSENSLFYPYTIIGGINLIFSIAMLLLYIFGYPKGFPRRTGSRNIRALFSPKSCMAGSQGIVGVILLFLLFMYYFNAVGGENVYGKWIFSFAIETDVQFTKDKAALLNSIFWFSHMAGRGVGIIVSKFLPIRIIILADIIGLLISSTALSIVGHSNSSVLLILTACMGFLVSPLFPAGMLWANIYLKMNSMTVMVCILGGSSGHLFYVYLSGYMFEYFGPRSMMFIEICYSGAMLLIFVLMEIFGKQSLNGTKKNAVVTQRPSEDVKELEEYMMHAVEKA